MPELPEVETVARSLSSGMRGRQVVAVDVYERRLRRPVPRRLAAELAGRRVREVSRSGKYILCQLDDGRVWVIHLGMSGRLTLEPGSRPRLRHDHVVVRLDDGRAVYYHDPRRFGLLALLGRRRAAALCSEAIDALDPGFTPALLFGMSRRRRLPVKALLMDQRELRGIGNIYASEILFRAGVRPRRRAGTLTRRECRAIVAATRGVLRAAIAGGGSSIADYRDGLGRAGRFQGRLRVYGRAGTPCCRCRRSVRRAVVAGRASFYCPRCQR